MKAVAFLLTGLVLAACGAGAEGSASPVATPTRADDAGVTIELPPGRLSTTPDDGAIDTLDVEPAAATLLERNGISLAVPWGWDGRVLFRDAVGASHVQFQVANFELPANEGIEPPPELPPGVEDPIKAMGAEDVLVMVVSDAAGKEEAPWPITLDDLEFVARGDPRIPVGHALAGGSFCRGTRCFRIEVDFGDRSPPPTLRAQVDEVLASLRVEQVSAPANATSRDDGPRGCPRANWPGPWTACAEADWVRRVVEAAGYEIVGETGSALVAEGSGRSFYIWTTRARRPAAAMATGPRIDVVDGVDVYGDDELWRFWDAQGSVFWVQEGPRGESIIPSPDELRGLIEAARTIPPP